MVEKPEVEAKPNSRRTGWLAGAFVVVVLVIAAALILTKPAPEPREVPKDPKDLLAQVVENLRTLQTFRLLIEQPGAPYVFGVTLDQGVTTVSAVMERAEAQYESPNILYALTKLRIGGLPPINVEIFARGGDQWLKQAITPWVNYPVAPGFDPGRLIQQDSGFPAALQTLSDLVYIGVETLPDGTTAHHVHGLATGQVINDLMFGLLSLTQDNVGVDVYVDDAQFLPALLVVTLPDTATEAEPEDTTWRIETYDFNGQSEISYPDGKGSGAAEATAESKTQAESTSEAEATTEATEQAG